MCNPVKSGGKTTCNRTYGIASIQMVAGLAAAILGAAIWAGIVIGTGYEVGYVAWGIGILVGLGVTLSGSERGKVIGFSAGGLAMMGLIFAKLFIIQWSAVPQFKSEILADSQLQWALVYDQMIVNNEFSQDVIAQIDAIPEDQPWPQPLQEKIELAVASKIDAMSQPDKEKFAEDYANTILSQYSYSDQIKDSLSVYDALWFFLAIGTAYRMAAGENHDEGHNEDPHEEAKPTES